MSSSPHSKPCTLCSTPRDVLVRCQIDASGTWHFVCPGACWTRVSGGVVDGDSTPEHAYYRYGGMWKNKHEGVSAKRKERAKGRACVGEWREGIRYTRNDVVRCGEHEWICRRGHQSRAGEGPGVGVEWRER